VTATIDAPAIEAAPAKVRPGKVWYWVFGLLTLLSLIAAGAIWLTGHITVENDVKAFARFIAPNEAQLRFKRDGQYVIYYEYSGNVDDTEIDASSTPPDGLELEMRDSQGQGLDLRELAEPLSYDVGGFHGVGVRRVRIDQAGEYRLSAGPPSLAPFAISVGRGEPPTAESWNQAAILVGAIGAGLGIIGLIVTGLLRRRSPAALADRQTAAALAAPVATPLVVDAPSAWAPPGEASSVSVPPPPPGAAAATATASAVPPPPPPTAAVLPPPAATPGQGHAGVGLGRGAARRF